MPAAPASSRVAPATQFSLDALIRHALEPEEEEWFAKCRIDFLYSTPSILIEMLRLVVALSLAGTTNPPASGFAVATAAVVAASGRWTGPDMR